MIENSCCVDSQLYFAVEVKKILHFVSATISQKAGNSGCVWFIQLSDSRCPIRAFRYRTLPDKKNLRNCCQTK